MSRIKRNQQCQACLVSSQTSSLLFLQGNVHSKTEKNNFIVSLRLYCSVYWQGLHYRYKSDKYPRNKKVILRRSGQESYPVPAWYMWCDGCCLCDIFCSWISFKPTNLWVTKTCHNVTCFFNWNVLKSLNAWYLLYGSQSLPSKQTLPTMPPFPFPSHVKILYLLLVRWDEMRWDLIKDVATRETSQHYEPEERQDATDVARCLNVWVSRAECGVAWCRGPQPGPAWPHPPPTTSNTCEVQRSQWDHTFQLGNISTVSPPPTTLSHSWQSLQILLLIQNISSNFLCPVCGV